jgi:hypothetical protein
MSITLKGGPYDGIEISDQALPRCPEIMCFTREDEDGFHVYSTNGPSETVREYTDLTNVDSETRDTLLAGIASGEVKPIELSHELYYEGAVMRPEVLKLWRQYREEDCDGTSIPPRSE